LKIKLPTDILIIDILSILLILCINFVPIIIARTILGLPFLIIFPGYVILAALFPKRAIHNIEYLAFSFGLSIAIVCLIGLGLNYTTWGIRLEPVLYSILFLIIVLSIIAIVRRRYYGRKNLTCAVTLESLKVFKGSVANKITMVIIFLAILGTMGFLISVIVRPQGGNQFTEFYMLGVSDKTSNYPTNFVLDSNQEVVSVSYGNNGPMMSEKSGTLSLCIINHEKQDTTYSVVMQIEGTPVDIIIEGKNLPTLGPISLLPGGKWESEIGIAPEHTGDNQEVDLSLYKDSDKQSYLELHLWINVIQQ